MLGPDMRHLNVSSRDSSDRTGPKTDLGP